MRFFFRLKNEFEPTVFINGHGLIVSYTSNDNDIEYSTMKEGLKIYSEGIFKPYPKLGFLFTGQGPDLLHRRFRDDFGQLYNNFESYRGIFSIAKIFLNIDFADLIKKQDESLRDPELAQPALVLISIANLTEYFSKNPELMEHPPALLTGHSLGELTALIVAGVVSFEDGLKIARLRGEIMKAGSGGMMAIPSLDEDVLREVQALFDLDLAVINGPGQVALSGRGPDIEPAIKFLSEKGITPTVLPITIAAHSKIMEEPQKKFAQALEFFQFNDPKIPIVSVFGPQLRNNGKEIRNAFIQQLTHLLNFPEMIAQAKIAGVDHFIEFGAAPILFGLVKTVDPSLEIISIHNASAMERKFDDFYQDSSASILI